MVDVPREQLLEAKIRRIVREELDKSGVLSAAALVWPDVKGRCPACGRTGLFVGAGGYLTCPQRDCAMPDAASALLVDHTETEHRFIVHRSHRQGDRTFTIRHPLMDRLSGALEDCPLHNYLVLQGQHLAAGRYRAVQGAGGSWNTWEEPDVSGS